jgi:Protein of unknown function (DUF1648)
MRRNFQIAIGLLWLAPVVMFLQYWMVWERLPQSVATHFAANGQPNGWMSRPAAVAFPLIPVLIVLLVATIRLARIREPHAGSWAILGLFTVPPLALIAINGQIITFNVGGTPIHRLQIMGLAIVLATFAAVLLCILVLLSAKRGSPLPLADVVAEQVHGSRVWTFLLLGPLLVLAFAVLRIPDRGVRVVFVPVTVIFLITGAATGSGFHYRFTRSGLEIRALGFRLRSIPKEQIRHYQPSSWNWTGGYGIRGLGEDRAYVWGNSGVRIATAGGSVFLGHAEPERLIHDLDVLTKAGR